MNKEQNTENKDLTANFGNTMLYEGWLSPNNPPEIPKNCWRHKKPFLVVDEQGETHVAIYATVDIRDGDMFIGEYEPKWVIREIYSDRNFEVIENPKAWSWLPTFV